MAKKKAESGKRKAATAKRPARPVTPSPPHPAAKPPALRLEWRTPEELADNPLNWRRHPQRQNEALAGVIAEVGWAGACLFNEKTGRLIDGHARKELPASSLVDGKLPVLIGSWTPRQERMILATLDPLAAMAGTDAAALEKILVDLETDDAALRDMLDDLAAANDISLCDDEDEAGPAEKGPDGSTDEGPDDVIECPGCGLKFRRS